MSVLCADAHECQIRSAKVAVIPRAAKVFYHAERRQRTKIKIILALCHNHLSLISSKDIRLFCRYNTFVVQDSQFQVSVATS
ncbi:hypothetical protein CFH85_03455 [Bacillus safensis]|nr:hypothetical protein CFH85_03455 [Bacillus safensis]